MSQYHFNYIITIHNKQDLIKKVLEGVVKSCGPDSVIYPVLDGCTDNTESIIDQTAKENPDVQIVKLYAPDVHEIKSLNVAFKSIPQENMVLNITLQDDVILNDSDLESKITKIYDYIGYEKVGTLAFRHGVNLRLDHKNKMVREIDLTESVYGIGMSNMPLLPNMLVERMAPVRSPECISSHVINTVGIFDENLAPYMWDNHDLSLRCLQAGYRNFVFSLPFISDIKWGGMKTNPHPNQTKVDLRNRRYLYEKHYDFLKNFLAEKKYLKLRIAKPIYVPGIVINKKDQVDALAAYLKRRRLILSSYWNILYIDHIRRSVRSIMYAFIRLHLKILG